MENRHSKNLKKEAVRLGLCQQWQKEWDGSIAGLAGMYLRGIDFCIEHDYPSLKYLEQHFQGQVRDYGIFISEEVKLYTRGRTVACLGKSFGKIDFEPFGVGRVHVLHESKIHINCAKNSIVIIDVHHKGEIRIEAKDAKNVMVNLFDEGKCEVINGNPKILER